MRKAICSHPLIFADELANFGKSIGRGITVLRSEKRFTLRQRNDRRIYISVEINHIQILAAGRRYCREILD
ncbi:hypothetical protein UP06_18805 [Bradyrhizobium sp. LTSP857]|nr:hypothetical protein UP06_18805 [Bradyrhizobium sp. LTSP857]